MATSQDSPEHSDLLVEVFVACVGVCVRLNVLDLDDSKCSLVCILAHKR